MPQKVLITVNLNINPATPPPPTLTATPDSVTLPDMQVGVAVTAPVDVVAGGTPPYSQPVVDPTSAVPLPDGLSASIDGSGNVSISGTPTVAGTGQVVLSVTDSGA